jgi:glycosyltransferase involved in cell wall biosynthesis
MADKLEELLDDPEKRARMGDIGRRRVVSELSWDHQVETLIAAYQRAGSRSPQNPTELGQDK